jgi:hypothetical protein
MNGSVAPKGYSIHIGLNQVNPTDYNGWDGQLHGCINDANSMQGIAVALDYQPTMLTDAQASHNAVLAAIQSAANECGPNDILLLTYSGHGGLVPDQNDPSGNDETWVLYDKMLLDKELYAAWGEFKAGVRIVVVSDSCHSGSIIKDVPPGVEGKPTPMVISVFSQEAEPLMFGIPRVIDEEVLLQYVTAHQDELTALQDQLFFAKDMPLGASVIQLGACQDNQTAADGPVNGLFTGTLLAVWNNGAFSGSYPSFHDAIVKLIPPTQSPSYLTAGAPDAPFEGQEPFTVATPVDWIGKIQGVRNYTQRALATLPACVLPIAAAGTRDMPLTLDPAAMSVLTELMPEVTDDGSSSKGPSSKDEPFAVVMAQIRIELGQFLRGAAAQSKGMALRVAQSAVSTRDTPDDFIAQLNAQRDQVTAEVNAQLDAAYNQLESAVNHSHIGTITEDLVALGPTGTQTVQCGNAICAGLQTVGTNLQNLPNPPGDYVAAQFAAADALCAQFPTG